MNGLKNIIILISMAWLDGWSGLGHVAWSVFALLSPNDDVPGTKLSLDT